MPEETPIPSFADVASQVNAAAAKGEPISTETQTPPAEVKTEPKVEEKVETKPETKSEAKVEEAPKEETTLNKLMGKKKEAKVDEVKPTEEKPIDWKTAPKEFRERHEKLLTEKQTIATKAQEFEKKVADYEARIKEIEAKTGDTSKADLKLVEEYTAKIAKYEEIIREANFQKSETYSKARDEYQEKYSQRYMKAAQDIQELQIITGKDPDTDAPITRQATEADLRALLGKSPVETARLTRQLFGADFDIVKEHLSALRDISGEAQFKLKKLVDDNMANGELKEKEQRLAEQKQASEYQQHLEKFKADIESEWPDYFKPSADDPEAAEALKAGYELVDTAMTKSASMTLQDRAAYNAVLRARAAAWPLMEQRITKLSKERDSLLEELKGFRGADPGKGGEKPAPDKKTDDDDWSFAKAGAMFNT